MEASTILKFAKSVQDMKAKNGHFTMNNIKHTKDLTAVLSVYDGVKPAHMILEELYDWAEENSPEVKELILTLEKDMNWNEKNPV